MSKFLQCWIPGTEQEAGNVLLSQLWPLPPDSPDTWVLLVAAKSNRAGKSLSKSLLSPLGGLMGPQAPFLKDLHLNSSASESPPTGLTYFPP